MTAVLKILEPHLVSYTGDVAGATIYWCACGESFNPIIAANGPDMLTAHREEILMEFLNEKGLDIVNGLVCCSKCSSMNGHRPGCVNE